MDILKEFKVESVKEENDKIVIITTGAKFIFDKTSEDGRIYCYQRINQERLVAVLDFRTSFTVFRQNTKFPFSNIGIVKADETTVVLHQAGEGCAFLRIKINGDSLMEISNLLTEYMVNISGKYKPVYCTENDGNIMLIDEIGGMGAYPDRGLRNVMWKNISKENWRVEYTFKENAHFYFSVFPPRRFNKQQSLNDRIAHHGSMGDWDPVPAPYPSNVELEEMSKYANILVLHETIWQGKYTSKTGGIVKTLKELYMDFSWSCFDYIPANENEFQRVIKKSHSLGMRVIPYMSPLFSMATGKDYIDRVGNVIQKYDLDGVYFDGINTINYGIQYAYELMRDIRNLVKDKLIYFHNGRTNIYHPFIDTYADFILSGEGTTYSKEGITVLDDDFLRYNISATNISNSIGHLCYYDLPMDCIDNLIEHILEADIRLYLGSPETERERLIKEKYFPKLEEYNLNFNTKKLM